MPWRGPEYKGEVPTLGWDILEWITEYLVVPDGPSAGDPLELTPEQAQFILNFYRVDPKFRGPAISGRSLVNARSITRGLLCRPKGWGKSPLLGAVSIVEALGDVILDGWDADGEPVARPWTDLGFKAKVQILATSEDQTENTWDPLLEMVRSSESLIDDYGLDAMETFIAFERGRIEFATSAGDSREGGRPVFAVLDQALALDTAIPTPSGWTTMGAIQSGDLVYGSSGRPVRVAEAKPVSRDHECFRVHLADGTSVVASDGHLWHTRLRASAARAKIRTTGEMSRDGRTFRIPVAPAQYRDATDLQVPPYLLGIWLGDGTRGKCEISVHESDLVATQANLAAFGVQTWARYYVPSGAGYSSGNSGDQLNLTFTRSSGYQGSTRPAVAKALAGLACYRDKYVPPEYLLGSIEQRTELLQGLMDSDGCCTETGTCTFVNTSPRITEAVVELLRSLGQVTSGAKWVADDRYTGGGKYRVDFTARHGFEPFRLPRKRARVRQHRRGPDWITVTKIELIDRVPVRCIAVDSEDHLFAFGAGGHLTHNTESWRVSNGGVKLASAVRRNLTKMQGASIESPNAYTPGDKTVAEKSFAAAELQAKRAANPKSRAKTTILLDHRQAPETIDIYNEKSLLEGLTIAYGDSADVNGGWVALDRIVEDFWDPDNTVEDSRKFFLNQITARADSWLSDMEIGGAKDTSKTVADGQMITLGFDGSRGRKKGITDATALIACRVVDGHIFEPFPTCVWEQSASWPKNKTWSPPQSEVVAAVEAAFKKWNVIGFYADPALWESYVAQWEAKWGAKLLVKSTKAHPIEWWMSGQRSGAKVAALKSFHDAVENRDLTHDGGLFLTSHIRNARMVPKGNGIDIDKQHPDSAEKIDAAIAAVLAWTARLDAIAAGALKRKKRAPVRRIR